MTDAERVDMVWLMEQPQFRRFLFRSIQTAGILTYRASTANGSDGRDLAYAEGRRSLGLDILRDADAALPAPLQHPSHAHTLAAIMAEASQIQSEKPNARHKRDRYDDIDGDDDGSAG